MRERRIATFEEIFACIGEQSFVVYGAGHYARVFRLWCREQERERQIDAFLVTDLDEIDKKNKILFGKPICAPSSYKERFQGEPIVLCVIRKDAQDAIMHFLDSYIDADIFIVEENSARKYYLEYQRKTEKELRKKYIVEEPDLEEAYINISDQDRNEFYKYWTKLSFGVEPDPVLFGEKADLHQIHEQLLGEYCYVKEADVDPDQKWMEKKFGIYMATSHLDKPVTQIYEAAYTIPIQVGASLTEKRICKVRDDAGENISKRNRDYCELSALYWAWKNDRIHDYIGLCHYRRRFYMTEKQFAYILQEKFDIVCTLPKLIDGGLKFDFLDRSGYISEQNWNLMEKAIRERYPDYLIAWEKLQESRVLIPLNMVIARRDVLNDYCQWLFDILETIDKFYAEQGIVPNDRYLGYLGEILTTLYLTYQKDRLKKAYCEIIFLRNDVQNGKSDV